LKYVDMVVQANDYIYIEPNPELVREVVKEIAPVFTILSSVILVFSIFSKL